MSRSVEPLDVHIANRVTRLRLARGLSQSDLGAAIGVTFQQVQKYESAINRISGSRLGAIARALDVSPGWLFGTEPVGVDGGPAPVDPLAVALNRLQTTLPGWRILLALNRTGWVATLQEPDCGPTSGMFIGRARDPGTALAIAARHRPQAPGLPTVDAVVH